MRELISDIFLFSSILFFLYKVRLSVDSEGRSLRDKHELFFLGGDTGSMYHQRNFIR